MDLFSSPNTPLKHVMAKKVAEMEAMIQCIPGVSVPFRKSLPHNYVDSLFIDSIALVEMPKKFYFPNMKMYNDTINPTYHIASYKQSIFMAAIS